MSDVAASVCDINILVNKLNREVRNGFGSDKKEIERTAEDIEVFLKSIKEWCKQ